MRAALMAATMNKYGLPSRGLVAMLAPSWDVKGRNILPVGSDNFVTGWTKNENITTVNVSAPDAAGWYTVSFVGVTTGGWYRSSALGVSDLATSTVEAVLVSGAVGWSATGLTPQAVTTTKQRLIVSRTGANAYAGFYPTVDSVIKVRFPQLNLGSLAPYSAPLGLPPSCSDYSMRGNPFQLGSASGADTNDPTFTSQGLVFGADDYCKSASSVFDDMQAFTCITALSETKTAAFQRVFSKADGANANGPLLYIDTAGAVKFEYSTTGETNTARWTIGVLTDATPTIVGLMGKKQLGAAAISGFLNATKQTIVYTESGDPANAIAYSDALNDLFVGNRSSANRALNGPIYFQVWYNRILSDSEYMQAYRAIKRICASMGVTI